MPHTSDPLWALPDPRYQPEFYDSVAMKRLFAWLVDVVLIFALAVLASLMSFGIGFFLFGMVYFTIGFLYRALTIAGGSATLGMRLMAIELRTRQGTRLDPFTAILHTFGYYFSMAIFLIQLISMVLMSTTPRGQGLVDMALGTTAINRTARHE